jgi:hypothetical protein
VNWQQYVFAELSKFTLLQVASQFDFTMEECC